MKKYSKTINPIGPKGYEVNNRVKELMGLIPLNENKSKIVIELTKIGPDGKAYAIIRENHSWFIKKCEKELVYESGKPINLVAEDFKYIGGLANKTEESYSSYAKAIKHLNLKFKSLAEAYDFNGEINVFTNDNLINETGMVGFSDLKNTFAESNVEEKEFVEEEVELSEAEEAIDKMLDKTESEVEEIKENRLSIDFALKNLDSIIESGTTRKKKV